MKAQRAPVSLGETLDGDEMQTTEHAFPKESKPILFVSPQSHDFQITEGYKVETLQTTIKQVLAAQKGMFMNKELTYQQPEII